MPRPKQHRRVNSPPLMKGYKPFGIPRSELETIILHYDEYEAIRLLDYEGLFQEQAAEKMNISRPTLTRIYENARKSVAKAFVEGKMIVIEGGNVEFDREWFRCRHCHKLVDEDLNRPHCRGKDNHEDNDLIPIKGNQK
ncbi:MAG: hypothetical protein BGO29_08125 [Bacteroidales bacterium 36-12]|nr:MAG: hypothetical protein BGO29_08125 [Bacteroidales bacterium 36-12]